MDKLINEFDKIVRWPKKPSDKEVVIKYLSTKFDYENAKLLFKKRKLALLYLSSLFKGLFLFPTII